MFKDFIQNIVKGLKIGVSDVQVGVVTYATSSKAEFYLNTHSDKASLLSAIQNISFNHPGLTFTSHGLQFVNEKLFNNTNGDRPDYPNTLVLLTDGNPLLTSQANLQAERLQNRSVDIFAVGVSNEVNRHELVELTKDSSHVQTFPDYGNLDNPAVVQNFVNKLMAGCKNMHVMHSLLKDPKIVTNLQSMICKN
jgi:collagen type VI alpha